MSNVGRRESLAGLREKLVLPGRLRVWWPSLLVGACALILYVRTAAPSLSWANDGADGGELLAAAETLGIAHPPGYPTYLLLLHLWTRLPLGDLARRGNLFSAFCAAAALALFTHLLTEQFASERKPLSQIGPLATGLLLAVMPTLWAQATITEVYTLHVFLFMLAWWMLTRWDTALAQGNSLTALWLGGAGVVWGLGMGNHLSLALVVPGALIWIVRTKNWAKRDALAGLIGVVMGLGVYAYLPLRAQAWPPINWGNPQSWEGFRWLISGQLYQRFVFGLTADEALPRVSAWAALLRDQLGWVPLGLAWIGLWAEMTRARWRRLGSMGVIFLLYTLYALGYDTSDSYVYLLPAFFVAAWWVARGLSSLSPATEGGILEELKPSVASGIRGLAVVLLLATAGYNLAAQYQALDLHNDWEAWTYGHQVMDEVPQGALLISEGDRHVFAIWYFRYGLGERPDVAVVTASLWSYKWYRDTVWRIHPGLAQTMAGPRETIEELVDVALARGRAVVGTERVAAESPWAEAYKVVQRSSEVYEFLAPQAKRRQPTARINLFGEGTCD